MKVRAKTKNFVAELKEKVKANLKPTTRSRLHQRIEIFSRLYYRDTLAETVNNLCAEQAPVDSNGIHVKEGRTAYTQRRLAIYQKIVNDAWASASDEQKAAVEMELEKERAELAEKKLEEEESDESGERTAESYLECVHRVNLLKVSVY